MTTKKCDKCNNTKDLSEFNKKSNSHDGKDVMCGDCSRARSRARYASNPERQKEKSREWTKNNMDKHRGYCKKWKNANRERYDKIQKIYKDKLSSGIKKVLKDFDILVKYSHMPKNIAGRIKIYKQYNVPENRWI